MDTAPPHSDLPLTRILVRGVNWLGDAVMSSAALLRLREAHPAASITLLTPQKLADLWTHHPAIDRVLSFGPDDQVLSLGKRLRDGRFEAALIFPNSFRSALETWWAGVPQRIGYRGQLRRWLLTRPVSARPEAIGMHKRGRSEILRLTNAPQANRVSDRGDCPGSPSSPPNFLTPGTEHHVHQYLHLTAELGANPKPIAPQLVVLKTEIESALRRFQLFSTADRPLFAINPGAEYGPAKRWPIENFLGAAREIQRQTGCQWLVLGGKGDMGIASQLATGIAQGAGANSQASINLAGATSLRELCAVLAACRLLLTNDTGPMHVAAALGTPVIVPFGSTSPELTGPGLPGDGRHRILRAGVPCSPCYLRECPIDFRCMRQISVAEVIEATLGVWRSAARG